MSEFSVLYRQIGYVFENESLLSLALTHSSYGEENYERLEFLGDALLDFTVGDYLYREYPALKEGELTKMRAKMVSNAILSRLYDRFDIGAHIKSQNLSIAHLSEKMRANFIESVLGAVYLDGGMQAAVQFVHKFICTEQVELTDFTSKLYEYCAINKLNLQVSDEPIGTINKPLFKVKVTIEGAAISDATASSIKLAKQEACRKAMQAVEGSCIR